MAMNPRARRGRPNAHRMPSGPRAPSSTDPRRRPSSRPKLHPDRPNGPGASPRGGPTASDLDSVLGDLTEGWERGERPGVERYLSLLRPEDSAELIYHEYCLAEASDLVPDPDEYLRRFPDHADRLARLFALHGAVTNSTLLGWAEPAELPSSGDEIGPYLLLRELGRGAFARVFLAEQATLDHRLVVLKVSTRSTAEPRLLARARHPHIVEVLRHDSADDGALHLICMPFLGGATLASVLEARRKLGRKARSGRDFLADLDRASAPEYPSSELARPAREILQGLSYPKALAWVVARLAEALDHAHARGVAHGDLKPSNVLMTAEGSPLLLDMNLATDSRKDGQAFDGPAADLGGTPAYMAPERLRAIALEGRTPLSKPLDRHRADLYSLGLLLLEALTGKPPEVPRGRPAGGRGAVEALAEARRDLPRTLLGRGDRSIPSSLLPILKKCLAPDPLDRYARGDELAEDLDLWRSDRPLAFVEESRRAILGRRARRRRAPLIAAGLTVVVAGLVATVGSMMLQGTRRDQALSKYSMIVDRADSGAFGLRRFGSWNLDNGTDPVEASSRQLGRYEVLDGPDWLARDDVRSLPDRERGELEAWLLEHVLRYAVALGRRPDSPEDWRRALNLLDRTLARVASAALHAERTGLRSKLQLPDAKPIPLEVPRAPRWMDDYLAGVAAEPLHAREALGLYLDALGDRPGLFWAHYRAAVVACRIDEYPIAAEHLRACLARAPENPILHVQLASVLSNVARSTNLPRKAGVMAQALAECDRAVALDPDYMPAYQVRARLRKASGRVAEVEADVSRFELGTRSQGPGAVSRLRLDLTLHPGPNYLLASHTESLARRAVEDDPGDPGNRAFLGSVYAMQGRAAEAISEYDRALDANPEHLRARLERASQLAGIDPAGAIEEYAALIEHPRFEELFREHPAAIRAFHHVATNLLDRGKVNEGLEIADRALSHIGLSRALQVETILARGKTGNQVDLSPRGETYYLKARLHAVAARSDRGELDRAVECLARAFACSAKFREGWFTKDRLFDDLRAEILERIPPSPAPR